MTDAAPKFELVLQWAKKARAAEHSPKWGVSIDAAIDDHGNACSAVWRLLYEILDERDGIGEPVKDIRPPPDKRQELRKLLAAAIKDRLPGVIDECIDELPL